LREVNTNYAASKWKSVVAYEAQVRTAGKMSEIKVDTAGKPNTTVVDREME
jgi:hypothetical protein